MNGLLFLDCVACNRTYYGEWGTTYSLSLSADSVASALGLLPPHHHHHHQPPTQQQSYSQTSESSYDQRTMTGSSTTGGSSGSSQFVCQLTFAAAGGSFGDLVEV